MALISLQDLSHSYGGERVFDRISLQIEPGERVCLVGRNGVGKSTLMKVLAGEISPDQGRIVRQQGLKVARLTQEVPTGTDGSIYDVVAGGIGSLVSLLARHHGVITKMGQDGGEALLDTLATLEHEMENSGAWQAQQRVETVLSRLGLDADADFASLSGGMKRRVLLARTLVADPDLLLLDEPTNHLDIEAIIWLESFLLTSSHTLLFVTHDRELLKKLATRILDLDRGVITSWPGDYGNYLRRREEQLAVEEVQQAKFDRKLAEEEIWIRQGIKARRTRNEGRVRALIDLRRQHRARREQMGQVRMEITSGGLSGKLVAVLKDISFDYSGRPVIRDLTCTVLRGDKIGIIGPNGVGKTTLLRIILGLLAPTTGQVTLGTNLQPVYFDQQRAQLDDERTVIDNLAEGADFIEVNGRQRHVVGYLRDFLFSPDRARSPVRILSGGERNRLLLAKLFAQPSNLLILDEPTNDLDLETLDLLEELLLEYQGTVLLVSHDRAFLNQVVTSTLVFEGEALVREYSGGYDDWLLQRPVVVPGGSGEPESVKKGKDRGKLKAAGLKKLSFKENRELEELPGNIEKMEEEQQILYDQLANPAAYQGDPGGVVNRQTRLNALEEILAKAYERWEALEARR
ncbi:MAG: ATP-binding cassette domain-containing protein [Proteobacteria bacterium]|nr:ATP-binding cassette domain-containing protein [Pseudomonadota bacterium]MBU1688986.1 ATP-binding cassette domain-containing protein [Pseudomonadota bacterium]